VDREQGAGDNEDGTPSAGCLDPGELLLAFLGELGRGETFLQVLGIDAQWYLLKEAFYSGHSGGAMGKMRSF
jgi:hypothetical protein